MFRLYTFFQIGPQLTVLSQFNIYWLVPLNLDIFQAAYNALLTSSQTNKPSDVFFLSNISEFQRSSGIL